jgi:hypothetical protein
VTVLKSDKLPGNNTLQNHTCSKERTPRGIKKHFELKEKKYSL